MMNRGQLPGRRDAGFNAIVFLDGRDKKLIEVGDGASTIQLSVFLREARST